MLLAMKILPFISFCILISLSSTCTGYVHKSYYASRSYGGQHDRPSSVLIRPEQTNVRGQKATESIAEGMGRLTSSLLYEIYMRAGKNFNIVLSPLSIWSILAVLMEGAGGKTEKELQAKLNVTQFGGEEARSVLRSQYKEIKDLFKDGNSQTEFTSLNYLIANKKLSPEFQSAMEKFYDGRYFSYDPQKKGLFTIMVNNWASDKSNGKISNIMSPAMLDGLVMLIGNAVYFKAKWKFPFDPLDTISLPFKDDNGNVIRSIPMMNMATVLPLGYNSELESQIIEIPYSDNKTSMIVILPHQKVSIRNVLQQMKDMSLREIIPPSMSEESVQLTLPRFHVVGKMYLNDVFKDDLNSIFSSQTAEFPRMGNDVFVSKIFHKAEIQNTEEGTTASAVTSVQFAYKSSSIVFRADRPFIYLINEVQTRNVLFAGTFSNPMTASTKF